MLSSMLSACVTALAGPISFVGIAVPHITRLSLKTTKPLVTIPAIFLCGSVFCMFCDLIARTIFSPSELAIGTVTAVFGCTSGYLAYDKAEKVILDKMWRNIWNRYMCRQKI